MLQIPVDRYLRLDSWSFKQPNQLKKLSGGPETVKRHIINPDSELVFEKRHLINPDSELLFENRHLIIPTYNKSHSCS